MANGTLEGARSPRKRSPHRFFLGGARERALPSHVVRMQSLESPPWWLW